MLINILKSKIHRATVTEARVDYVGSITIDSFLMKKAGIIPYEKVMVVSIDSGQRLETYVIEGESKSGTICLNGAAARLINKGEKVIIMAFCSLEPKEADGFLPKIVHVDEKNHFTESGFVAGKDEEC
ncbi:MAG TPA: aspartate 1-decarboxylase [Actinobacteria bacterium]|nr:aspartate 1-decarboxylase [Actinomycetota bacterium]